MNQARFWVCQTLVRTSADKSCTTFTRYGWLYCKLYWNGFRIRKLLEHSFFFLLQIVLQTVCSLASDYIFELENGPGEIVVDCRSFNRIGVDIPFLCFSFIYFPISYGKLVQFKVKVPNIVLVLYNEFHFGNLNLFVIW